MKKIIAIALPFSAIGVSAAGLLNYLSPIGLRLENDYMRNSIIGLCLIVVEFTIVATAQSVTEFLLRPMQWVFFSFIATMSVMTLYQSSHDRFFIFSLTGYFGGILLGIIFNHMLRPAK